MIIFLFIILCSAKVWFILYCIKVSIRLDLNALSIGIFRMIFQNISIAFENNSKLNNERHVC